MLCVSTRPSATDESLVHGPNSLTPLPLHTYVSERGGSVVERLSHNTSSPLASSANEYRRLQTK